MHRAYKNIHTAPTNMVPQHHNSVGQAQCNAQKITFQPQCYDLFGAGGITLSCLGELCILLLCFRVRGRPLLLWGGVMLWPVWSFRLLALGVGHDYGIYFTFPSVYNLSIYIPSFICGCDVMVILFFGIFCLQRVLRPLGATLGPFTLMGAQHSTPLLYLRPQNTNCFCCGGFPGTPPGPFRLRNGHTETHMGDRIPQEWITNYKVRHNITTNTNVHLIMRTIKPQLMF